MTMARVAPIIFILSVDEQGGATLSTGRMFKSVIFFTEDFVAMAVCKYLITNKMIVFYFE